MLLDIIFLTIIVLCIMHGVKRGIIKTVLGLSSFFVSIIAALLLYQPFMDTISSNPDISSWILGFKDSIRLAVLPTVNIEVSENTPEILNYIISGDIIAQGNNAIATAIAEAVVYLITVVLFIVLIKLLVTLLFNIFKVAAKMPVIKQANGLIGGLLGLVIGIFVCWIAAAVLAMFIGQEGCSWITDSLSSSMLAKHMFKSNIIFTIFK